jgi:hypothetical protein
VRVTVATPSNLSKPPPETVHYQGALHYLYGAQEIADALRAHAITVLDDESRSVKVKDHSIELVGIPNVHVESARSKQLLAGLVREPPSIVLTHGGQISLPGVGILKNASKAPLRWSHGLVRERGQWRAIEMARSSGIRGAGCDRAV